MEPAALQLTEKETSWKRHIASSWNALYNRLSVGLYMFPALCFARTDRNKIVGYILDLYTPRTLPNTALYPLAKNLLRWFVRFPSTCHSRANPTDFTAAEARTCATLFTAGLPCCAQCLSHWKSGYPCPTVPYPFATFQYDDIVESLFPCSIKDLMQFMKKDRVEVGLPVPHTSAAACAYICRCSSWKSV